MQRRRFRGNSPIAATLALGMLLVSCTNLRSGPAPQCARAAHKREGSPPSAFKPGQRQIAHHLEDIPYKPCPPQMPGHCELAVLEGNPKQAGMFTIRIRTSEPFVLPPHTHPRPERVTVLAGKVGVGFGGRANKTSDRGDSRTFNAGDFYVNAPDAVHFVWADEPVTIQITGQGPWVLRKHSE